MEVEDVPRTDGITQVSLRGSLDMKSADEINLRVHTLIATRRQHALMDLSGLEFVSSIGMGVFVSCATSLRRHGKVLVLVAPTPSVLAALQHARMDSLMKIADSIEAGVALITGSAPTGKP